MCLFKTILSTFQRPFSSIAAVIVCFAAAAGGVDAQVRNNPYSPSPSREVARITVASLPQSSVDMAPAPVSTQISTSAAPSSSGPPSLATDIYRIGVGDVISINLNNTTQGAGYFTVGGNGTIDYPLAGDNVPAAGRTVDEIQRLISSQVRLYQNPSVTVKVREYNSHRVTVSGIVERPGEKQLRREAVPLYVVRAEALVNAAANRVSITRAPLSAPEVYDLASPSTDSVVILPGNAVEFSTASLGAYSIRPATGIATQKTLTPGLTLKSAVAVVMGTTGNPRKAVIRRIDAKGKVKSLDFNLHSINDGKVIDPFIQAGDVIEIKD
ncbi:MAG: polysaccharide biosynthesis/export family protein [Pyrinomonadaceae bacterium]